jgi:hypothetical protein
MNTKPDPDGSSERSTGRSSPRLDLTIQRQPDDTTCGPTCLQAVYAHFGDVVDVHQLVEEVDMLETGGTLATLLGLHALRRGYRATLYSFNLEVLDPTWRGFGRAALLAKLDAQERHRQGRQALAVRAARDFIAAGGEVLQEDLTAQLIRKHLRRGHPILTGLSATWLYRCAREIGDTMTSDDVRGDPQGHFVVLCGYDPTEHRVWVADPYFPSPMASSHFYDVAMPRLVTAILLGALTYDAALLVITPPGDGPGPKARGGSAEERSAPGRAAP